VGTPIAATTGEQWTPYFSVDVIAGVTLHSPVSRPDVGTIVLYTTHLLSYVSHRNLFIIGCPTHGGYVVYWHP